MVFGGEGFYDDFKGFNLILRFWDYDFWIQRALISLGVKFELIWRILIFLGVGGRVARFGGVHLILGFRD